MKELKIDPELRDLLPPLADDEYKQLEKNIVDNGFDKNFPIMEWHGFIVDGHNRYSICRKHNIEYTVGTLAYETKEEVMRWMLDIQLGRRNLTPIQRISVAEKHRALFEAQAKERQIQSGIEYGKGGTKVTPEMVEPSTSKSRTENETNSKLAAIAGVKRETYRMGSKILNSDNDELKQRVLSGKTSITAGYKELQNKNKPKVNDVAEKPVEKENNTAEPDVKPEEKPPVESGVILLPEDTKENKIMNDIVRQMKSGTVDMIQLSNEKEITSIAALAYESIDSVFNYIFKNIDFEKFSRENFNEIENILLTVKATIDNKIKIMEEKISYDATPKQQIVELDQKLESLDKNIESLQTERSNTVKKRGDLFKALDVKCPVKYKWIKEGQDLFPAWWKCQIYIDYDGLTEVLGEYHVSHSEFAQYIHENGGKRLTRGDLAEIP
ncbi:MAG: hypothetical protein KHX30_03400 [Clostridium sp.]|nr:hypothetical protein [Clostridium sp.]